MPKTFEDWRLLRLAKLSPTHHQPFGKNRQRALRVGGFAVKSLKMGGLCAIMKSVYTSLERTVAVDTWQAGLICVAKDTEIVGEALRVFLVVVASVEVGHFAPITPAMIARVLNRHPSNVKKALRVLVEKGVIRKRYETGSSWGTSSPHDSD